MLSNSFLSYPLDARELIYELLFFSALGLLDKNSGFVLKSFSALSNKKR